MSILYASMGEADKAIKLLQIAWEKWPFKDIDILLNLSLYLRKAGKFLEAEKQADLAVQMEPYNALAWFTLGEALKDQVKQQEAIIAFKKACSLAKPWSLIDAKARDELMKMGKTKIPDSINLTVPMKRKFDSDIQKKEKLYQILFHSTG